MGGSSGTSMDYGYGWVRRRHRHRSRASEGQRNVVRKWREGVVRNGGKLVGRCE